jgi:hypothetical protein
VSIRRFVETLLALALSLSAALSGCVPGAGQFSGTSSALLDGKQRPTVGVVLDAQGKATVVASSVRNFPEAGGGGRLEGYVAQRAGPVGFTQLQTFRFDDSTTVRWLEGSLPIDRPWAERYPRGARLRVRGTAAGLLVEHLEEVRDTGKLPQPPLEGDRPQLVVLREPDAPSTGGTGGVTRSPRPPLVPDRSRSPSPTVPGSLPPDEAASLERLLTPDRWLVVRGRYGVVKGLVRGLKADPIPAVPASGQTLVPPGTDRVFRGIECEVSAQERGIPVKRWVRCLIPSEAASLRSEDGTVLALYRPGGTAPSDSFPDQPVYFHFLIRDRQLYVTSIQLAP